MYRPEPIDTKDIHLTDELSDLRELLAKNTHDIWSKRRIEEGWIYGERRDDVKKTNPCLVEYENLPESEKEYDRCTSEETLKLILKLGYEIRRKNSSRE